MKKMKKYAAAIMAAAMVLGSLAGCGSGSSDSSGSTKAPETKSAAVDTADQGSDEGASASADSDSKWMIGDPDDPIELTVFLNHTWYGTESFTGIIPDEITKRTGIRLVPTKATDYTQLGVLAASGELPDLVFTSQMMDLLSDPDICYAYDELIEQYNVDWDVPTTAQVNAKAFSQDDHYYFVFSHESSNKDWENTRLYQW